MTVLAECPACHTKQAKKNKRCIGWLDKKSGLKCNKDLDEAKQTKKVRYWISYRTRDGNQRRESVGAFEDLDAYSLDDAVDAMAKRRVQKRERKMFDELPETTMTFAELAEWYLGLEKIKELASYDIIKIKLDIFNKGFGDLIVSQIRPAELENYQVKRLKEGAKPATVDQEIGKVRAMVYKAFDNDLVGGDTIKTFKRIKKLLKPGSDVRDRVLSGNEFKWLLKHASGHIKGIIMMGYYTGMRKGEILNLTWDRVDLQNRMIRLEAEDTKDREKRNIPICDEIYNLLGSMPNRLQDSGQENHVFQFKRQPISDIRAGLRRVCKKANIKYGRFKKGGFIFHDLRHTFNTNMRKAGVAESVIMRVTGHSTREMFDRYNTIDESDTRQAVTQMVNFIQGVDHSVDQGTKKAPTDNVKNSVRA